MAKKLILLLSLLFGAFAFADAKDGDIQYLVVAEKHGFSTIFTTDFKNFFFFLQFYYLTIERLSDKMCTFAHSYKFVLW